MSNQNRTIMGALDYSIASLQGIKKALMDISHPDKELNWAVGGLIITLVSRILRDCQETFIETGQAGEANAKNDLKLIQAKFNQFIEGMINHE